MYIVGSDIKDKGRRADLLTDFLSNCVYITNQEAFIANFQRVLESVSDSPTLYKYISGLYDSKERWCFVYRQGYFYMDIDVSSRVEANHAVIVRYCHNDYSFENLLTCLNRMDT
jgi:thiamine kinase-like enzyme